jgi:polyhydroxybutyrate depolymerase
MSVWFRLILPCFVVFVSLAESSVFRRRRNNDNLVERSLEHDGLVRWFLEYRPAAFTIGAPVVIVLHGGTQSMRKIFNSENLGTGRWLDLSDKNGFLLLAPNGVNLDTGDTFGDNQNWSDLRFLGSNETKTYDDVGFLSKLVQWSITEAGVDPSRVYVTGASNGGLMTYTMLVQAPQLFAAGAAFIANLPAAAIPTPSQSTPIFIMNGDKDRLMPWEGGGVAEGSQRGTVRSAFATRDYWIQENGADTTAVVYTTLPNRNWFDRCRIQCEAYPATADASSAPVQFYRLSGGGHCIPSPRGFFNPVMNLYDLLIAGPSCHDVYGADVAWEFLSRFTGSD